MYCTRKQDKTSCKRRPGRNGLSCGAEQIVSGLESNCGGGGIVVGPGALRRSLLPCSVFERPPWGEVGLLQLWRKLACS